MSGWAATKFQRSEGDEAMKPDKEPFFRFYFVFPLQMIGTCIKDMSETILTWFGWWHCAKCGKFYSPRVKKYDCIKKLVLTYLEYSLCSVCKENAKIRG